MLSSMYLFISQDNGSALFGWNSKLDVNSAWNNIPVWSMHGRFFCRYGRWNLNGDQRPEIVPSHCYHLTCSCWFLVLAICDSVILLNWVVWLQLLPGWMLVSVRFLLQMSWNGLPDSDLLSSLLYMMSFGIQLPFI